MRQSSGSRTMGQRFGVYQNDLTMTKDAMKPHRKAPPESRARYQFGSLAAMRPRIVAVLAAAIATGIALVALQADAIAQTPVQGVASPSKTVPRFVSLRASEVNLRRGPGTDYPIAWVFRRAGLPVEVIRETEAWRQVRDADGTTGWVIRNLLSRRRTALVLPWEIKPDAPRPQVTVRTRGNRTARAVVNLEAGVIADVVGCDGQWCQVSVGTYTGYLAQKQLWGVYPDEVVR